MSQANENITIREIKIPEDGEQLANLFNSFNDSWEGGFMGEGENTIETALDIAKRLKRISIFVAEFEKKLVGYCSLHPHYQDEEACYVGILGVHSDVMNKKIGKRLILKSLEKARIEGFLRLDLGTWAGNMKAMPLYKKLGLKWVPETSVQMECYIPMILNQSLFKPFWVKHPDWYSNLKLTITQAPDEEKYTELDTYNYKFESGDDFLYVWIDRYAKTIIGFDYKLDHKRITIGIHSLSNKGFRGVKYHLNINVESLTELRDFFVVHTLDDEVSIEFNENVPSIIKKANISATLNLDVTIPKYKLGYKGIISTFTIKWNGGSIDLSIGLKIESAIEIRLINDSKAFHSNHENKSISFIVQNKIDYPLIGKFLVTNSENVECPQTQFPINLPDKNQQMITLPIEKINSNKYFTLNALIEYETQVDKLFNSKTEEFIFVVPVVNESSFQAHFDNSTSEHLRISNGLIISSIDLRGGYVQIGDEQYRFNIRQGQQLGPPFGFDEFDRLIYEYSIKNNEIELIGRSGDRPGLTLRKKIFYTPSSPLIKTEIYFDNKSEIDQSFSIRLNHSFNFSPSSVSYFLPIKEKIVEMNGVIFPRSFADLGTSPDIYSESWITAINVSENQVIGLIWSPNKFNPSEIRIDGNQFVQTNYPVKINNKSSKMVGKYWLYVGPGDWNTIRNYWMKLSANKSYKYTELPQKEKVFSLFFRNIKKIDENSFSIDIIINTAILASIKGELYLNTEDGEFKSSPFKFELFKEPKTISTIFTLFRPLYKSITPILAKFKLPSGFVSVVTELDLYTTSKGSGEFVKPEEISKMQGYVWSHPKFRALSVPEYSAGFTWLKTIDEKCIFDGPFPEYKPLFFLPKNQGGLNFQYAKNFNQIIQGKGFQKYKGELINKNNLVGLKLILERYKSNEELPEVIPEIKILGNSSKSNLIFSIKFISVSNAPQEFTAFLGMTPKPDEGFTIQFVKDNQNYLLPSSTDQRRAFATPDPNTPVKIMNNDKTIDIEIVPDKKHYSFSLIVDFPPAFSLIGFLIPIEIEPKEVIEHEFEVRFN